MDNKFHTIKDISYTKSLDPHPRQKLDLYVPNSASSKSLAPVVLFVHGGAWKRGGRDDHRIHGHAHVGRSLARQGFVCGVPTYRLSGLSTYQYLRMVFLIAFVMSVVIFAAAITIVHMLVPRGTISTETPDVVLNFTFVCLAIALVIALILKMDEPGTPAVKVRNQRQLFANKMQYPDNIYDIIEALKWMSENVKAYGGDPENIWLCGHSAGGVMVTLLTLHPEHLCKFNLDHRLIKGVVSVSGCYNIRRLYRMPLVGSLFCVPAFGHDEKVHLDASPINHVCNQFISDLTKLLQRGVPLSIPFLLINAESDYYLHRDAKELRTALEDAGIYVESEIIRGFNHRSIMWTRDLVTERIDRFIRRHTGALVHNPHTTSPSQ